VSRHEHFEELCAAASIGQASGTELAELNEHLANCPDCRQAYSEFLQINASQYSKTARDQELSRDDAVACIDSALFRERFLKKAEAEGIVFSNSSTPILAEPRTRAIRAKRLALWASAAAVCLVLAAVAAGTYYWRAQRVHESSAASVPRKPSVDHSLGTVQDREPRITTLEAENRNLITQVESLKASLASASLALARFQASSLKSEEERSSLLANLTGRDSAIADLQSKLHQAQDAVASVRGDLAREQSGSAQNQAALIEAQLKIRELSDQLAQNSKALDRERDLLAAGRDIRELMAARNLHIVDVFDTDPKGKTRPAFGRIFFTEGKSLLFYAYDMPDARLKDAGYHYRIWGKKEGPNERPRNLGIFFSDDKAQKRWVFQYDDPKVLNEIDSVFVTLEPPNGDSAKPKGDKLMYAYLRGQANHP
jgi:hypothetical protein